MTSPTSTRATKLASLFGVIVLVLGVCAWALRPTGGSAPAFVQFVGRFHTLALHLPIGALALLVSAEMAAFVPSLRGGVSSLRAVVLPFLAATAAVAFFLGALLASGGGYPSSLIFWHRTLTLVGLVFVAAASFGFARGHTGAYRGALAAAVLALSGGAHFGGSMTHGDDYLTRYSPFAPPPKTASTSEPVAKGDDARVFADVLAPILRKRCNECHGDGTVKGGLRLDSYAAVMKGGKHGVVVVPGKPAASPMHQRLVLPASDDDHMPPEDKPGLSAAEIALVRVWIERGASESMRASDLVVPEEVSKLVTGRLGLAGSPPSAAPEPEPVKAPAAASTPAAAATTATTTAAASHVAESTPAAERLAFRDDVLPMLVARCGSCHAGGKKKGGLSVDSFDAIARGGKSGAGGAKALLARAQLPLSDDKHMPPSTSGQLASRELALLAAWAADGSETMREAALPAALRGMHTFAASAASPPSPASTPSPPPAGDVATPAITAPTPASTGAGDLHAIAQDVLMRRCGKCHAGTKSAGGLRIDDEARMIRTKVIVPGRSSESPLAMNLARPLDDDMHMPPSTEPQLTADEAAAIRAWIDDGARSPSRPGASAASEAPAPAVPASIAASAAARPPAGCGGCALASSSGTASGLTAAGLGLAVLALRRRRRSTPPPS